MDTVAIVLLGLSLIGWCGLLCYASYLKRKLRYEMLKARIRG